MQTPMMVKSTMNIANKKAKQSLQLGTPVAAESEAKAKKVSLKSTLQ